MTPSAPLCRSVWAFIPTAGTGKLTEAPTAAKSYHFPECFPTEIRSRYMKMVGIPIHLTEKGEVHSLVHRFEVGRFFTEVHVVLRKGAALRWDMGT